jgi:pimeloyl-ACP methyl ester carboxylesterase
VGRRFTWVSAVTTVGILQQMRSYLHNETLKAEIDQRVKEGVASGCRVLVGHSLGSVVAAEFLRRNPDHSIALLLTLGSPLGLRFVRSRFPTTPLTVPSWVNIRDRRDPVACAGPLHTWWPQIAKVDDIVVENGDDTHAVERYLSRRATGEVLIRTLPELVGGQQYGGAERKLTPE